MLCCLLLGAVFGPLGVWIAAPQKAADCCGAGAISLSAVAAGTIALAVAGYALWLAFHPVSFHHICGLLAATDF